MPSLLSHSVVSLCPHPQGLLDLLAPSITFSPLGGAPELLEVLASGEAFPAQGLFSVWIVLLLWHGCHFSGPAQQGQLSSYLQLSQDAVALSSSGAGSALAGTLLLLDALPGLLALGL